MREKVRVSFDVPIEEHTFIKTECAKSRIAFRDLMKEVFHKTYQEMQKRELHDMLLKGFEQSYEGKTIELTDEDFENWNKSLND